MVIWVHKLSINKDRDYLKIAPVFCLTLVLFYNHYLVVVNARNSERTAVFSLLKIGRRLTGD